MTSDYPIVIYWSDEDEVYIAKMPDLEPCSAYGETPEEVLREILVVKELWLEVAREKGYPIPALTHKPELSRRA
jgi:predicted RNase H-like HicB family nuclease